MANESKMNNNAQQVLYESKQSLMYDEKLLNNSSDSYNIQEELKKVRKNKSWHIAIIIFSYIMLLASVAVFTRFILTSSMLAGISLEIKPQRTIDSRKLLDIFIEQFEKDISTTTEKRENLKIELNTVVETLRTLHLGEITPAEEDNLDSQETEAVNQALEEFQEANSKLHDEYNERITAYDMRIMQTKQVITILSDISGNVQDLDIDGVAITQRIMEQLLETLYSAIEDENTLLMKKEQELNKANQSFAMQVELSQSQMSAQEFQESLPQLQEQLKKTTASIKELYDSNITKQIILVSILKDVINKLSAEVD